MFILRQNIIANDILDPKLFYTNIMQNLEAHMSVVLCHGLHYWNELANITQHEILMSN